VLISPTRLKKSKEKEGKGKGREGKGEVRKEQEKRRGERRGMERKGRKRKGKSLIFYIIYILGKNVPMPRIFDLSCSLMIYESRHHAVHS
jgi:hypothetical protein